MACKDSYNARLPDTNESAAMAAPDAPSHESPIKTPKQLITVIALAFIVPIIIVTLLARLAASGMKLEQGPADNQAVLERIRPVASVNVGEAGGSDVKGERSGAQIVQAICAACHQTGAAGAPKMGDRAAWGKLIAEGQKHLAEEAIKGVRAMPPRGGNPDLTNAEVERAVVFMANQAGANFKEPAASKPAAGKAARK
jgi:cytochrome c5